MLLGQVRDDLRQADVRPLPCQRQYEGLVGIQLRSARLPLLARRDLTRLAIASIPSHRSRNTDPKTSRSLASR